MSGYVDTAAVFNPGGVGEGYDYSYSARGNAYQVGGNGYAGGPGYYAFAKANGFYLNSVDIALDKPQDESPWASGYHAELMFGPDATPSSQGPGPGTQTVNIRQAYLALRTPIGNTAIDWKVGVFDTIIGYESTTDGNNPNYTRSYGYTMEPTTHTGVLGTFKAADWISFSAGVADTTYNYGYLGGVNSGTTVNAMNYPSALGSIALTAPDSWGWMKGATFSAGVINSPSSNGGGGTSYYAGATVPTPLTALKVGASFDYLDMHNQVSQFNYNPANDNIWCFGGYASYQFNDKLSFNVRGEYLNQQGAGYNSGTVLVPEVSRTSFGSFVNPYVTQPNVEEFTATVQYQIWANVLSRVEFRWDHAESGTPFAYGSSGQFGTKNAYTLALNLIYQF